MIKIKECHKCREEKSIDCFYKNKRKNDGIDIYCKDCSKEFSKNYSQPKQIPDFKTCYSCEITKPSSEFHKKINTKDGLCNKCKECRKPIYTAYNNANKEKVREYNKKYWLKNKEKLSVYTREWQKKKKKEDPLYHLSHNIRSLIKMVFSSTKNGAKGKPAKTEEILGCKIQEFLKHLESQFSNWMSWDNFGKCNGELKYGWDLDHIVPVSSATTEEELIRLNHWSNFQPLCSHTNRIIKRDKLYPVTNLELNKTFLPK